MTLKQKALLFSSTCLLFACLCLGIIGYLNADNGFSKAYNERVSDQVATIEKMLDVKYPGSWEIKAGKLYKGKQSMEEVSEELDTLAGGNAITIFRGDTRVSTTVKQENGSRAVGTQCSNEIYTAVIGKGDTVNTEAEVVGVPYYTCYVPLRGNTGENIGMLFVGSPSAPVIAMEREYIFKMAVASIVLFIVVAVLLTYVINKKMVIVEDVARTMGHIADGDLTDVDLTVTSSDELGKLADSTNRMKNALRSLMINLSQSASQVAAGSKNISDSSGQLSNGATVQAASVEELSASIMQIASQTKSNADNASAANNLSTKARTHAEAGNTHMQDMLDAMKEINVSSANISKIIKVIDEIAFQTNILSLNAAVEAARAGQHGKGFAVVADEVRNLAARSAKAAKETTDMIENSISKVNDGMAKANQTAEMLKVIVDNVEQSSALVSSIAQASSEQSLAIEQINQGVQQVSQVVQSNSATAEECASASVELTAQADSLHDAVAKFKI